ncbi:acyltransferase family protein [bacterium]|nr:acyltransferase family protein [bacterium]
MSVLRPMNFLSPTCPPAKAVASQGRVEWLDVLRTLACLSVVMLHVANQNWYITDFSVPGAWHNFSIFNFYESLVHWGVPIFVMISGSLFLDKKVTVKKIWSHYIARIALTFAVWTSVYALFDLFVRQYPIAQVWENFFAGQPHMWYLFLIVGLYASLPVLQPLIKSDKRDFLIKYFVGLSLVFGLGLIELINVLQLFGSPALTTFQYINYRFCFYLVCGYTGYFLLGYYLTRAQLSANARRSFYALGVVGAVATTGWSWLSAYVLGQPVNIFFENLTLNVWAMSVGIFVWVRYHAANWPCQLRQALVWIAPYTLGIYLVHPLVVYGLYRLGIHTFWLDPWLSVPVNSIMVVSISLLVTMLVRSVPKIGKLIA